MEGLIRTQKQSERMRGTHFLESTDGGASQDTETIQASDGVHTIWRAQTEGLVRTLNESERPRGTHRLESADGGTRQDTERILASEGH
jgi:hypothetical protein